MRLIDANALKTELDAWAVVINKPIYYVRDDVICVIDAAPTIAPMCGKKLEVGG